ncbi:MAG: glycosyltransferase [Candidatus Eisenbacteria bacterium]
MHLAILASHAYEGLRGRQQQIALGLAARGHQVFYVEPFLLNEAGAGIEWRGLDSREEAPGLRVLGLRHPTEVTATVELSRSGLERWSRQVRGLLEGMIRGDSFGSSETTAPRLASFDLALIYAPVLIEPAREALSVPVVFDCEEDFPATASSRALADVYTEALNQGLPLSDGLLAVNRYLVESWGRLLPAGAPRAVVEHGADLDLFRPPDAESRRAARQALAIPPAAKAAAYVGRFDARISFEDLRSLFDQNSSLLFLLLGEINDEGRAILERLPPERVIVRGPLPQERVAQLLSAADLILIPLRREPHLEPLRGLTLYEYLATGLPVVGTFRRATKAFRDLLYLYATQEELSAALQSALAESPEAPVRAQRIERAREAAWAHRVEAVESFLKHVLATAVI